MVAPSKTPTVASVERAFTIIEQLAHSKKDLSISEVSHQLQLPKSTTHTIMVTFGASNAYTKHLTLPTSTNQCQRC
ncbi:MAG TPA: hypothetical protein DHV65_12500 [Ktedonobacter sp.]|nr:hypothetical protein [Ktedonobacter sp.]